VQIKCYITLGRLKFYEMFIESILDKEALETSREHRIGSVNWE
jgi:hypothetical protein